MRSVHQATTCLNMQASLRRIVYIACVMLIVCLGIGAGTVTKESMRVLPGVAVLLQSTPRLGGTSTELLDWLETGPLIINEV